MDWVDYICIQCIEHVLYGLLGWWVASCESNNHLKHPTNILTKVDPSRKSTGSCKQMNQNNVSYHTTKITANVHMKQFPQKLFNSNSFDRNNTGNVFLCKILFCFLFFRVHEIPSVTEGELYLGSTTELLHIFISYKKERVPFWIMCHKDVILSTT